MPTRTILRQRIIKKRKQKNLIKCSQKKEQRNFLQKNKYLSCFLFVLDEQNMGKRNSKIKKMKRDQENKL